MLSEIELPPRRKAKNIFGPALRRAREQSRVKMTQSDLAALLNSMGLRIDRSAISRMENQEVSISDVQLVYFAKALEIDLQKLFELHNERRSNHPPYEDFRTRENAHIAPEGVSDWQPL
jgi:transcriptional regulator with XRE-family HTH domain